MPSPFETLTALTLLAGTFFMTVACVGLLRLPDVFCRMHAAGKAGTLGVSLVIVAASIDLVAVGWSVPLRGLLAIFFQYLTTPAATHLLARAAYVTQYPLTERTAVDELRTYLPSRPGETYGQE
jgi:multicomponent Na+:H+ antiporter subunit G